MHGRLRVKTTEQQEAEKAVEREKKLAKYNAGTQLLFKKRKDRVYDEETALQLSQILAVNPDFYTLWNYRREIFLHWKAERSTEYLQSMLKSDLHFTEQCLGVNPKSYCAWHHRCWVMENMPTPDWAAEVELCDKYLKMDGRNFHCWDYRRFAVAGAGRRPESELAAADLLIRTNFSNYSSWHYRSHLLTQLYPAGDAAAPIREDKYLQELELVQSAAFTDPDDQAAWFYHRWLLQARRPTAAVVSCTAGRRGRAARVVVALARAARPADVGLTLLAGDEQVTRWTSPADEDVDTVWVADTEADAAQLSVQITSPSGSVERVPCDTKTTAVFASDLSAATGEVLKQELENVRQLGEMEPDNKWVLLSSVVIMWALDPRSHKEKILTAIDDLMKLDRLRRGYYEDLRSRFVTERRIESCGGGGELSLADCRLTTLPHTSRLTAVTALDVSRNRLRCADLSHLVAADRVTATDNRLARVRLPADRCCSVACLLLDNNRIRRVADLGAGVTHSVREVGLAGNPVCDTADFRARLLERFPRLEVVNGERV